MSNVVAPSPDEDDEQPARTGEKVPPEGPDETSAADRVMAARALRVLSEGGTPERMDAAALKRVRKEQEKKQRHQALKYLPQTEYVAISGREVRMLLDQADRYGLPLRGRRVEGMTGVRIDLTAVIPAFHDLIAANARMLGSNKRDGVDPTARAQIHDINLRVKQLELAELEKQLVRFDVIEEAVLELFARLKTAHDLLRQSVPADAMLVVEDAMAQIELYWRRKFGDETAAAEQRRHEQATQEWSI